MTAESLTAVGLELALEHVDAMLWEWLPDTDTVTTVHPPTASLFGHEIESFEEFTTVIHPDDRQRVEQAVESALDLETPLSVEFRIEQDGEIRWFETRGRISPENQGGVRRVFGLTTDITERKRQAEQFQTYVEHSSDVITVVDEGGLIEYISPSVSRVFGNDPDDLLGESVFDLIHPADREEAMAAFPGIRTLSEGTTVSVEYRTRHSNGSVRWVESRFTARRDSPDQGYIINTRDVTDRVEVERAHRRTEESQKLALEAADAGIWSWDIETDDVTWHESCENLFGVEPGTFEGTFEAFARRVHPADLPAVERAINRTLDQNGPYQMDYRIVRDDGNERWVTARGKLLSDDDGNPGRLLGVAVDITELKERERSLEEYEVIVEAARDPIYSLDGTGQFTLVNDAIAAVMGRSKEDLVGTNIMDLLSPADVEASLEHIWTLASGGPPPGPLNLTLSTPDGPRELEVNIVLHGDNAVGGAPGTIGVARDVTNLRERERRLSVLDRVLRHNVRNKLNIILAHSEQLADVPDPDVHGSARKIVEASEELYGLSETARRFESTIRPDDSIVEPADTVECVRNVAEQARTAYSSATIRTHGDEEEWALVHEAFELAVTELVENAIKHAGRPDPTVDVYVDGHESTVEVRVVDNGSGLPDLERQVFLNGEETPLEHGMGLGLWLVRWTIINSGGTVELRDNHPTGTVVEINLPRPTPSEATER